ncbi:hypothetical protein QJS04_geneDACA006787 [Acorus gramineus]|uniref:Uncharacterized protein n=1 Tax=Acorus gramineus TaxID=55184 RepID=A0AAV9AXF1_ACOGR|nr:hypothetical protein QJS04_geneDACA006787 [Acorus gramineus]
MVHATDGEAMVFTSNTAKHPPSKKPSPPPPSEEEPPSADEPPSGGDDDEPPSGGEQPPPPGGEGVKCIGSCLYFPLCNKACQFMYNIKGHCHWKRIGPQCCCNGE